jgi:hypothetical protein
MKIIALLLALAFADDKAKLSPDELRLLADDFANIQAVVKQVNDEAQTEIKRRTAHEQKEINDILDKKCKEAGIDRAVCDLDFKNGTVVKKEEKK